MRYVYMATIAAILLAASSGAVGAGAAEAKPGTVAPAASTPSKVRRTDWASARKRAAAPRAVARERCDSILCPRYMVLGVGY